jgi:hypothetical protein
MASSFNCKCGERLKPVNERNWEVVRYRCNYSAFNGYHYTPSNYSTVVCNNDGCNGAGRTKASFVDDLVALGKVRVGA